MVINFKKRSRLVALGIAAAVVIMIICFVMISSRGSGYARRVSSNALRTVTVIVDAGHGGMDGIEFRRFIDCVRSGEEMPIDVYDAASWMSISCLTELSIAQGGMPQAIPDFTHGEWLRRPLKDVVPLPVITEE